ncbi:TPR-like protein [Scleroderma citrinum]
MSFQNLISGSECAIASNPLSQVLKHTEGDRSLQQDRVAGPSSSRLQHLPGSVPAAASEHDITMARQFFEGQQGSTTPALTVPPQVHCPEFIPLHGLASRPTFPQAWTRESQQATYRSISTNDPWASEFNGAQSQAGQGTSVQQSMQQASEAPFTSTPNLYNYPVSMRMHSQDLSATPFFQGFNPAFQPSSTGKGKAREADFEAAFAQVTASFNKTAENTARIVELDENTTSQENSEVKMDPGNAETWANLQESNSSLPQEDLAKWEAEFNQLMTAQRDELEYGYGSAMQNAWESGLGDYNTADNPKLDEHGYPILGEYIFDRENKYLNQSSSDLSLLNQAKDLLERNGSLSEAALLLEAAIQKGELGEGRYEAWVLLGETRSMDEREEHAMRALVEGVRQAEITGANGAGMLSLAISYTNESYDRASCLMLFRWLRARFPTVPIPADLEKAVTSHSAWDAQERLTDAFLTLARQQYEQGIVDADVQIALGILFYNNTEYDRAKDCFESALSSRPRDYLLWNRLGSCLSNGNKPEEALGAYREALNLRPTYTRAIYNVGVACLNIGAYKEATEHFLSALAMQDASGTSQTSDQLWHTLRRALLQMDRGDLLELAKPENRPNLELFRQQGFDF